MGLYSRLSRRTAVSSRFPRNVILFSIAGHEGLFGLSVPYRGDGYRSGYRNAR